MKQAFTLLFLTLAAAVSAAPRTMRFDYFHTGNAKEEHFSWDRVVIEPLPWPGNPARPLDDLNLGRYFFEVRDAASGRVLYSRGFASVYGEWETTAEAGKIDRTFSESLRFPLPDAPVKIVIEKRDAKNEFQEVWQASIDPKSMFVDTSAPSAPAPLLEFQKSGDSAGKVDFLIPGTVTRKRRSRSSRRTPGG
jgi:hypothetical protein